MSRSWQEVNADMDAITRARGEDPEARRVEAERKTNAYVAGYRLGELRKRAGVTQAELASRLGISQARVSQLEAGDPEQFVVDTIHRYASALGGELTLGVNFDGHHIPLTDSPGAADEIYA